MYNSLQLWQREGKVFCLRERLLGFPRHTSVLRAKLNGWSCWLILLSKGLPGLAFPLLKQQVNKKVKMQKWDTVSSNVALPSHCQSLGGADMLLLWLGYLLTAYGLLVPHGLVSGQLRWRLKSESIHIVRGKI